MSDDRNRRILVIDDNRAIHDDFKKILARRSEAASIAAVEADLFGSSDIPTESVLAYEIDSAYQGQEGLAMVQKSVEADERYALAFVDMRMPPGWDGLRTIQELWKVDEEIQVVICTAFSDYSWEEILSAVGTADRLLILKKPFDTAEVCQLACALTEKWWLARRAHLKLSQLRSMVEERTGELRVVNERLRWEIAERLRTEQALRASEARYALASAGANDGLWDWDISSDVVFLSERWYQMLGEEALPEPSSLSAWFERVHAEDLELLKSAIDSHLVGSTEQIQVEYRVRHADGQYRWVLCRGRAARDGEGQPIRAAGSQTDITERKMAEAQLEHDARHDPLTGLANRAGIETHLDRRLERTRRGLSGPCAVLFLDLDGFKKVNDTHGHGAGDTLLRGVAERLAASVRGGGDLDLGTGDLVSRLGGDEFVIVLDTVGGVDDAVLVASRVLRSIAEPFVVDGVELRVGTSIGIAIAHNAEVDADGLLARADAALYDAKRAGRGRWSVSPEGVDAPAPDAAAVIEAQDLVVRYDPVLDFVSQAPGGVVARVSWQHPDRGLLLPDQVFAHAQGARAEDRLVADTVAQVCDDISTWLGALGDARFFVSVVVPAAQAGAVGFAEMVVEHVERVGIPRGVLRVDVGEEAFLGCPGPVIENLATLRAAGVGVHLDHFGSGHASLSYLYRVPVDALKIDRSLVTGVPANAPHSRIVEAIAALAHVMGAAVIADGVDTTAELNHVRAAHCDLAIGAAAGAPMTAGEVAAVLGARARMSA